MRDDSKDALAIRVRLPQEFAISVPEHQVFLSFNADDDAAAFVDWWWEKGGNLFLKYADKKKAQP